MVCDQALATAFLRTYGPALRYGEKRAVGWRASNRSAARMTAVRVSDANQIARPQLAISNDLRIVITSRFSMPITH
jgi:hypothetical protein